MVTSVTEILLTVAIPADLRIFVSQGAVLGFDEFLGVGNIDPVTTPAICLLVAHKTCGGVLFRYLPVVGRFPGPDFM
jgi:hypothetical protein